jgi:hypothetical protein
MAMTDSPVLSFPSITQAAFIPGNIARLWTNRQQWANLINLQFSTISQLTIIRDVRFIARFSADSGLSLPERPLVHLAFQSPGNGYILACNVLSAGNGRGYYEVRLSGPVLIQLDWDKTGWFLDQIRSLEVA